ncbi:hypothetical protein P7D92_10215 [Enterococcus dongliensis]|uniref:hypothetical protein n=1 Tax=Enterococcus dongliensis TaxID=2559925 RepID=UPI00288F3EE5|nr:hypothetical protein [Enterococcus dongliensis]MDT2677327.1 hypothetical protein [Enterococcus dongliensis]
MAVDHIQETDTLNAGRGKINQAIDLANSSSTKVDQYRTELDQGVADAKTIATNAGNEAKATAETAANEAKQTASNAATNATNIATVAGQEAKTIAETAGAEANVKADKAIADSRTAVDNSNQAIGRANQNKQEFDALEKEFDDLIAQSGDSTPEIVQARTDSQGVKQDTLQNRLAADFGIRLTNADAIKLFSGPVNVPKMMDLAGKVAGNTSANPHSVYTDYTATSLKNPAAAWSEITQENYNKLVGRDDSGVSVGSSQGSVIPQQLSKFDTVKAIEQLAPRIFEGMTVEEKVQYIKDNFISFSVTTRAKASSPNNKNLKVGIFLESTESYTTKIQGDATEFTDFTTEINDSNFIDSNGNINVLSYVDSSNGVTAASLNTDYIGVQLMVSLNPLTVLNKAGFANEDDLALKADKEEVNTHLMDQENPHGVTAEQVGAYSAEGADKQFISKTSAESTYVKIAELNKNSVGLSDVENYAVATQSEAEEAVTNVKYATPLRVKQQTDKRLVVESEALEATDNSKLMTPKQTKTLGDKYYYPTVQKFTVYNTAETAVGITFDNTHIFELGDPSTIEKVVFQWGYVDTSGNFLSYGWTQSIIETDEMYFEHSIWLQLYRDRGKYIVFNLSNGTLKVRGEQGNGSDVENKRMRLKRLTVYRRSF